MCIRDSLGLGQRIAAGGELGHGRGGAPGRGPAAQMAAQIGDLVQRQAHLAHVRFKGAFAQVLAQGGAQLGLGGAHGALQRRQSAAAEGEGQGFARGKEILLAGGQLGKFHHRTLLSMEDNALCCQYNTPGRKKEVFRASSSGALAMKRKIW